MKFKSLLNELLDTPAPVQQGDNLDQTISRMEAQMSSLKAESAANKEKDKQIADLQNQMQKLQKEKENLNLQNQKAQLNSLKQGVQKIPITPQDKLAASKKADRMVTQKQT
jgi:DNA repair exonuclease SbcCD ATPase subunit